MGAEGTTRLVPRSQLKRLLHRDSFLWCTGIEDTFVFEPHARTQRALDEYDLTGHYDRWEQDLRLMPEIAVPAARYGIPWYKVSPAPGKWDWSFADKTLDLLLHLGIDPIVDLVHYGTPGWMEDSFLNPDFPRHMAEFAASLAQKFRGRIRWYTPLNEPRITAYYCGKLGKWPPYRRGWDGFLRVMISLCKGIVLTCRALEIVDPEIVRCHVDATDLYEPSGPIDEDEAKLRQEIVFLALDLTTGKVHDEHPLHDWLIRHGVLQLDLDWFSEHPVELDVLGINLYPMFSLKRAKTNEIGTKFEMPYAAGPRIVKELGRMYWERYRCPIMITETASTGSVQRRQKWMDDSVQACRDLREEGVPLVGYTWWPMFSLVSWTYRGSDRPLQKYLLHMGLWDLEGDLERRPTPLVDAFRSLVEQGSPGPYQAVVQGGALV